MKWDEISNELQEQQKITEMRSLVNPLLIVNSNS